MGSDFNLKSDFISNDSLHVRSEEFLSKTKIDHDDSFLTKVEAIYENASSYTNLRSSVENTETHTNHLSPKKLSYSDADVTSLSNDEDYLSWQRYYATGETTPRNSLLSLV